MNEGNFEVRNPHRSAHGPGTACSADDDCSHIACQCNIGDRTGHVAGVCLREGKCRSAGVGCSAACEEGGGPRYALVIADLAGDEGCKSKLRAIEPLACKNERKPAATARCAVAPGDCITQTKARLACEAKQTWSCNDEYGIAVPADRTACANLHVQCPPDDPPASFGSSVR